MSQLDDQHRGEIGVALDQRQVELDEAGEPVGRGALLGQLGAGLGQELGHLLVEEPQEQVVLALEVEIDGAVGDARALGDLGHRRAVEAALGKDLDGRIEDARALVVLGCACRGRGLLRTGRVVFREARPGLNEGSFR